MLAPVLLVPVLLAGCSSTSNSTTSATTPSPAAVLPTGGEAEAFCSAVEALMTDLQALASGQADAAMMGNLQQQAATLQAMAAEYESDLARDPTELQKVQDCLGKLSELS